MCSKNVSDDYEFQLDGTWREFLRCVCDKLDLPESRGKTLNLGYRFSTMSKAAILKVLKEDEFGKVLKAALSAAKDSQRKCGPKTAFSIFIFDLDEKSRTAPASEAGKKSKKPRVGIP
jgi:hypothetical protein